MLKFIKNKYAVILVITTLGLFVFMALSSQERDKPTIFEDALSTIVAPVQKVFFNIATSIESGIAFISEINTLKDQNETLTVMVEQLEEENRRLQALKDENVRLREMLGLQQELENFEILGAQIIAKDPGNWFHVFTINKGTAHGVKNQSAVITNKGLVGHVFDVRRNSAKVMSIIDSDSAVSALMDRTRDIAVVKGDLTLRQEGLCKLSYVSKEADIIEGDAVITSGLGGIYPKGILIGRITQISKRPYEITQHAIVEPEVDFKRLEKVFIILKIQEEE